ncbi:MAG: hypothetical protein ACREMO_12245 [Gemmatimonadales bacterium]
MTTASQTQKRHRAAAFPPSTGPVAACGQLDVQWESPFDRLCFMIAAPDLLLKNSKRYAKLLEEIIAGSGCTEEEILAHGNKVRAVLFFVQDRLTKDGTLDRLTGKAKYTYHLPTVTPAF